MGKRGLAIDGRPLALALRGGLAERTHFFQFIVRFSSLLSFLLLGGNLMSLQDPKRNGQESLELRGLNPGHMTGGVLDVFLPLRSRTPALPVITPLTGSLSVVS